MESNTKWKIKYIDNVKMLLSNSRWYQFLMGRPKGWNEGDEVDLKPKSTAERQGPFGKSFNAAITAKNSKGGKPQPITFIKDEKPTDQSSPEKRFNTPADVELKKEYFIEDMDSNDAMTVGSRRFKLNTLAVDEKAGPIDWRPKDVVTFSKGVSKDPYNFDVQNLRTNTNHPKLSYFFPKA